MPLAARKRIEDFGNVVPPPLRSSQSQQVKRRTANKNSLSRHYFARALRFSLAQALSFGTAFSGGPPSVPQAHGPSVLATVMQEQDFVFMHAQT